MEMSLPKIYLASGSPRRKFLLESCGLDVERVSQDADETWPTLPLAEAIEELARRKMASIAGDICKDESNSQPKRRNISSDPLV